MCRVLSGTSTVGGGRSRGGREASPGHSPPPAPGRIGEAMLAASFASCVVSCRGRRRSVGVRAEVGEALPGHLPSLAPGRFSEAMLAASFACVPSTEC